MRSLLLVVGACFFFGPRATVAVSLRASTPDNSKKTDADNALSAVMDMVGSLQAEHKPRHVTAAAPAGNGTRAKLDMGFTGYEKNLTQQLVTIMRKATSASLWTNASRERLIANVTGNISLCLKEKLKSMKQSVGKTWMALPEDEQKNLYVNQLRNGFLPVFADNTKTVLNHFARSGERVEMFAKQLKPMSGEELLSRSEQIFTDSVVSERCYGGEELIQLSLLEMSELRYVAPVTTSANASNQTHKKLGKFCLPSPIEHMVSRLNDTQGLLSMTMRFEAGAMDMVQTGKKAATRRK